MLKLRSQPSRILAGLIAGLVMGTVVWISESPTLARAISAVGPIGTLWVNALQMTVIPLVVSLLIGSVVSASEQGRFGPIAGRALMTFLLLYITVAAATLAVTPLLLSGLQASPGALDSSASGTTVDRPADSGSPPRAPLARLIVASLFVAKLYGIDLTARQLMTVLGLSVL
jgi:proton glutamate symport protein